MSISRTEARTLRPAQDVILGAACELMVTRGFGGMSIRALAQHVGVQPGSIYNHFNCKQDILEALAELLVAERVRSWRACKPREKNHLAT